MELGKRKNKLESYVDSLMESPEKKQKRIDFEISLRQFYKKKWNCPVKPPTVHGLEFDLYKLYDIVMAMGGWQKVSTMEKWADIAEMFGAGENILGADHAIKIIYMRYLSKFEQSETVGDMDDMMESELLRSRGRHGVSFLATSECPVYIPKAGQQDNNKAPGEVDYSRLTKSLLSGLPNEEDFAFNVCTLLSHPGPRLLRIGVAPHILSLLLAHVGVFDEEDDTLLELHANWKDQSGRDYFAFWKAAGIHEDYLKTFVPQAADVKLTSDVNGIFAGLQPTYSPADPLSWRVCQVATIVRNLSFEHVNKAAMADSWPLIKFLLLCANSDCAQLSSSAFDSLSNLSADIDLTWSRLLYESNHALFRTISTGIFSNDKFKLIRSMEVLAGLCGYEGNEPMLAEFLSPPLIQKMLDYLIVKDIMLCVYTLECIYQISEMGITACDLIAVQPHAISLLISLSSVEAVSFGPTGLAGMKVVEYHPPGVQPPTPTPQPAPPVPLHPQQLPPHIQQQLSFSQAPPHIQQQLLQQHGGGGGAPPTQMLMMQVPPGYHPPQQQPQGHQAYSEGGHHAPPPQHQAAPPLLRQATPARPPPVTPTPPPLKAAEPRPFVGESKIEQLTASWVRQNCEADPRASTSRGDLYAAYVDDLRNHFHSLSGSLQMFTKIINAIYPDIVFKLPDNGSPMMYAFGLRLNKPHKLAGAGAPSATNSAPARSSASSSSSVSSSSPAPNVSSHPIMQQMLAKPANGAPPPETAQMCQPAMAAGELFPDDPSLANNEARIVRVSNPSAPSSARPPVLPIPSPYAPAVPSAPLKSAVARRLKEKGEKGGSPKGKEPEPSVKKSEEKQLGETDGVEMELVAKVKAEVAEENKKKKAAARGKKQPARAEDDEQEAEGAELMCEWDGCGRRFLSSSSALVHAMNMHLREDSPPDVCKWPGCDATQRTKWSLVTHLQDHHMTEHSLRTMAAQRREGRLPPRPPRYSPSQPRDLPQHPGYSRNAATEAIRRHALNFITKDFTEEPEGPVTKSIRLTSCLILRNLARYSTEGRSLLRRHERHLSWMALSRLESHSALAQLLSEMHEVDADSEVAETVATSSDTPPTHSQSAD